MSTKTNFKRIALVAVAALGLGVLSSVPSQAAISGLDVTVVDGTAGLAGVRTDSTNAAVATLTGVIGQNDSIIVTLTPRALPTTSNTPVIGMMNLDSVTPTIQNSIRIDTNAVTVNSSVINTLAVLETSISGTVRITKTSSNEQYFSHKIGIQLDSATSTRPAGTYSYTLVVQSYEAGATLRPSSTITKVVNIVIAAAATSSTTPSSVNGFAYLSGATTASSTGASSAVTDSALSVLATAGTTRAYIYVGNRNTAGGAATALDSLTATVSGVGLVCTSGGSTCGTNIKVSAAGDYQFELRGNGNGGTSSVTVTSSVTGAVWVKTLNYYAAEAKTLTATVLTPVLKIGSNDSAVSVKAVDAAGSNWGGTAYIYASAAADATAVGGSATTPVACVYSSAAQTHYCPITATAAGSGKFKVIDASTTAAATATSNEVTVKSSAGTASSVKIAFNKATYAPFEKATITITPVDAAGAALQSATYTNLFASGGITTSTGFSTQTGGTTDLSAVSLTTDAYSGTSTTAGAYTYTVYMPASGTVTLTATGGTALPAAGQVKITASATVTDSGAAALAAVNALATTVASLRTLITTLTNLVLKIQKKVKA
jgi:hypothetical protein